MGRTTQHSPYGCSVPGLTRFEALCLRVFFLNTRAFAAAGRLGLGEGFRPAEAGLRFRGLLTPRLAWPRRDHTPVLADSRLALKTVAGDNQGVGTIHHHCLFAVLPAQAPAFEFPDDNFAHIFFGRHPKQQRILWRFDDLIPGRRVMVVLPDGSKEGWPPSDYWEGVRKQLAAEAAAAGGFAVLLEEGEWGERVTEYGEPDSDLELELHLAVGYGWKPRLGKQLAAEGRLCGPAIVTNGTSVAAWVGPLGMGEWFCDRALEAPRRYYNDLHSAQLRAGRVRVAYKRQHEALEL